MPYPPNNVSKRYLGIHQVNSEYVVLATYNGHSGKYNMYISAPFLLYSTESKLIKDGKVSELHYLTSGSS